MFMMFKTNFTGHNNFRVHCPPMPPVATGLVRLSCSLSFVTECV